MLNMLEKHTISLSGRCPHVYECQVTFQNAGTIGITFSIPTFHHSLRNLFKEDIQKAYRIKSDLRENMGLCRGSKEKKKTRMRHEVFLQITLHRKPLLVGNSSHLRYPR